MPDRIGQQLGNYQLLRLLGAGGFAEVYLGEHIHLGTQAAIKVLHTQLTSDDVDKFRTEARTIARLIHPHIVRILEFGIESTIPFLVMDYAPNGTLRQRHPKGVALSLPLIVTYIEQLADALQHAHDEKLIHRDVKPDNMLLGRRNEVLLSDFGIALVAQSTRYQSAQEMAGTMAYMAPEQIQGKPRPASDQYSLGIVVYEWLTGDRPFHGSLTELVGQHLTVPPPSLLEKVSTIPPEVDRIIQTALAKDPKQRFESVQAFANALHDAAQHPQSVATASIPTIESPTGVSTIPPESVSQPLSDFQPEVLVPPLTATKSAYLEPTTQTTDTVASSQMSTPMLQSSSRNHRLTFPQPKRRWVALVLILVILILVGAGSLGLYTAIGKENISPQADASATAQANASATAQANASIGKTWYSRTSGTSQDLLGVAWSGSQLVVVGANGTILTSSDGSSWTPRTSGTSQSLYDVAWSGSQFVAVGNNGTILMSSDGSSWTPRTSGTSQSLYDVAWSGSQFVAVGNNGTILTSSDGNSWTPRTSGTSQYLLGVGRSGSQFVAVGASGTILTSSDGSSWTSRTSSTSQPLYNVGWSGSQFVVVGYSGTILTSPDGSSWTPRTSGTSQDLLGVGWSGSQFVVVGYSGIILTSPDGSSWTPRTSGTSQPLWRVGWSSSQFVVVGFQGTILTSP